MARSDKLTSVKILSLKLFLNWKLSASGIQAAAFATSYKFIDSNSFARYLRILKQLEIFYWVDLFVQVGNDRNELR